MCGKNMKLIIHILCEPQIRFILKQCRNGLQLIEKGDIYKSFYEGWYCTHDETFVTESDASQDVASDMPIRAVESTHWFRKKHIFLNYQHIKIDLLEFYEENPEFYCA